MHIHTLCLWIKIVNCNNESEMPGVSWAQQYVLWRWTNHWWRRSTEDQRRLRRLVSTFQLRRLLSNPLRNTFAVYTYYVGFTPNAKKQIYLSLSLWLYFSNSGSPHGSLFFSIHQPSTTKGNLVQHHYQTRVEHKGRLQKKMLNLDFWLNLRKPLPRPPIWALLSGWLFFVSFKSTPFKTWNSFMEYF